MKRLFLTSLLLMLSFAATFSQKALLDRTAAALKNGGVEAAFTATASRSGQRLGATSGTIYVRQNRFKVVADGLTTWFDGKTQWTLLKGSNEVNVTTPTAAELQQINPYHFVSLYKKGYTATQRNVTFSGVSQPEVTLKAQDASAAIQTMVIVINKVTHLPLSVKVVMKKGTTTEIQLSRVRNNLKFGDALFRFNAADYPKITVNDLR
ncbi:MAG: outer-membrane lipoprotein carrier protein LolA [Prevotellaceae bacterium]|nr:outer-membrane lipoprotein carrier protein LolA [Prevotellaceae bacterium]